MRSPTDPLTDPRPGDVVGRTMHGKRFLRTVFQRTEPGLHGTKWVVYQTKNNYNACTLARWQEWCGKAEVIYAEPE